MSDESIAMCIDRIDISLDRLAARAEETTLTRREQFAMAMAKAWRSTDHQLSKETVAELAVNDADALISELDSPRAPASLDQDLIGDCIKRNADGHRLVRNVLGNEPRWLKLVTPGEILAHSFDLYNNGQKALAADCRFEFDKWTLELDEKGGA